MLPTLAELLFAPLLIPELQWFQVIAEAPLDASWHSKYDYGRKFEKVPHLPGRIAEPHNCANSSRVTQSQFLYSDTRQVQRHATIGTETVILTSGARAGFSCSTAVFE